VTETRVLVVTGPTTSGKTGLSIPLAEALDAEIVSMDSRQVYRGMDIGTDKVTEELRRRVPHHGLDLVYPDERFSAGRWARLARGWTQEIRGRGRLPLLVGGTGFYLKALLEPVFREPAMDPARRDALRRWLDRRPQEELGRWTDALDPHRSELSREGGRQRLSRTLEVALLTGRPLSWWHRTAPPEAAPVRAGIVLLTLPRELLYDQINRRAERMFERGLLDEVKALLDAGFSPGDPGMTGTGYREAAAVLRGELSLEEALDRVQRVTRGYARRQLTWFRNQLPAEGVLRLDATRPPQEGVDRVRDWWARTGGAASG
jgi:tRNA dimethylallyltransferase